MKRILLLLACLAGCASVPTAERGRVGAAASSQFTETINIGATVRSTAIAVTRYDTIGYAIRSTGTSAGTWTVQYSNDFSPGVDDATADTKWDTYTLSSTPPAATGSAQVFGIILDSYEYAFVRIKFTYTSGAGSALIAAQLKGS